MKMGAAGLEPAETEVDGFTVRSGQKLATDYDSQQPEHKRDRCFLGFVNFCEFWPLFVS